MSINLPSGSWILFHNLSPATTAEEIQDLLIKRTGVEIPLERISVKTYNANANGAIVSLDKNHICDLLDWALSEDTLHGRGLRAILPNKK